MIRVMKEITRGASLYGRTDAVGDLVRVKQLGAMPCGSGDDHVLTARDRRLVQTHNPDDGDLTLPPGPLGTATPRPIG
jgi:hypothetical protein